MTRFLQLPAQERRLTFTQAAAHRGLPAASIEKDFWVCLTLRELFSLPGVGDHLTFKGGTSLSKVWRVIERFSEDIDLTVGKEPLGFGGDASPSRAPSQNQRRLRLKALVKACRRWTQDDLQRALRTRLEVLLGGERWSLSVDPEAEDGQCLVFNYPVVFEAKTDSLRPRVKIELGGRADTWPAVDGTITPYAAEALPEMITDAAIPVRALVAERTFWEKAMLLHEETFRSSVRPRKASLARHYYDLWCLINHGVAARAAADDALFAMVAEARQVIFSQTWVDYATLKRGSLHLVPRPGQLDEWRRDYQAMRSTMIFGQAPTFEEVLAVVAAFEQEYNRGVP